jgi:hypothetical protein
MLLISLSAWEGKYSTSIYLAAFRSIKHHPDREVVAEVFKPMFDAGGGE